MSTLVSLVTSPLVFGYEWLADKLRGGPLIENLQNKCVFITGCDSGFGNELAKTLDKMGVVVFAGCLTEEGRLALKDACSSTLRTLRVDVTDTTSIEKARDFVKENIPPNHEFWGVTNNAGVLSSPGPVEFMKRSDFQHSFEVNCFGMAEVCRLFLPLLKTSHGRIVNMASMGGRVGFPEMAVYGATKFAVEGYTEILRREAKPWGVSVHLLEPQLYKTSLSEGEGYCARRTKIYDALPDEVKADYGKEWLEASTEHFRSNIEKMASTNIHEVVDAYIHALFGVYPKTRYLVGGQARVGVSFALLPDYMSDIILQAEPSLVPNGLKNNHNKDI